MCLVCVCVRVCEYACVVCECLCICVCAPSLSGRTGKTLGASQHCPGREGRSRQKLIQTHMHTHAHTSTSLSEPVDGGSDNDLRRAEIPCHFRWNSWPPLEGHMVCPPTWCGAGERGTHDSAPRRLQSAWGCQRPEDASHRQDPQSQASLISTGLGGRVVARGPPLGAGGAAGPRLPESQRPHPSNVVCGNWALHIRGRRRQREVEQPAVR